ncbi:hypothetical protein BDW59DRAFT_141369 [Aspergillus cavernicola]|uniref:Uncharacterized protein n=1 Tax=Aspergillus cavernicola TaxID=176166 RepID=A0ABR4ITY6_9EURO
MLISLTMIPAEYALAWDISIMTSSMRQPRPALWWAVSSSTPSSQEIAVPQLRPSSESLWPNLTT